MKVKKLKSENVGTHHPEQSIIFTEKGEIYVTKDELTLDGYELLKFQTFDLEQLTTIVNSAMRGNPIRSAATVQLEDNSFFASSVTNLYKVDGYEAMDILNRVIGGYEGQIISIVGNGQPLQVKENGNIRLSEAFTLQNNFTIIRIQKVAQEWVEISRNNNQ